MASLLAAGSCGSNALAQQEGDKVVVIAQKAPLRSVEDTTGTVTKGAILVVRNVSSDWFWVTWSNGYGTVKGWINHTDIVPYSQALPFFTRELKQNPTAAAYNTRGAIWNERGEHDRAIEDFSEAIRLDPQVKQFYNNRGVAWDDKAHYEEAIADYDRAIELIHAIPSPSITAGTPGPRWRIMAAQLPTTARRFGSTRRTHRPFSTALTRGRSGRSMERPSPTMTRPFVSTAKTHSRTKTAPAPGARSASSTGDWPITTRRFGSIRRTRSPSWVAATPGGPRRITARRSLTMTRRCNLGYARWRRRAERQIRCENA